MGRSKKFLKDTSKAARESNQTAFEKLKNMFTSTPDPEEEKKKKRKELIEKERARTYEAIKPRKY